MRQVANMSAIQQYVREKVLYATGYYSGRFYSLPGNLSQVYAFLIAKVTRLVSLPLPLLSFLALPLYGGTSTTINLLFFYLTWSAMLASYDPLTVEIVGTALVRLLCFLLPALWFLVFDITVPNVSKGIKAHGERHLPHRLGRNKLLEVAGVAIFNVVLSIAVQYGLEVLWTQVLHLRSILRVSSMVPLPWNIAKDLLRGLVVRGVLHYGVHRLLLHTSATPLKTWHLRWQHSVELPFSLVAAYDQPINYLLSQWLPTFLPAYLFRFHVLTWHLFLVLVSLEDLFVYSGYAVLPSSILVAGMARRTDAHFDVVQSGKEVGNFGHLGLLDFVFGTTCKKEVDVVDDVQGEVDKHNMQQRIDEAVRAALAGMDRKQETKKKGRVQETDDQAKQEETSGEADASHDREDSGKGSVADRERDEQLDDDRATDEKADDGADSSAQVPAQGRSGRHKAPRQ